MADESKRQLKKAQQALALTEPVDRRAGNELSDLDAHHQIGTVAPRAVGPRTAKAEKTASTDAPARSSCVSDERHASRADRLENRSLVRAIRAALADDRASDIRLDQYYTRPDVAARLYGVFREHFDPTSYRMVEPSAGEGSFFRLLPADSVGYDIEPRCAGIDTADFLEVEIPSDREIAVIGNPPFGKNASKAVRFLNHAARQSSVVALILPKSFRKASIQNRIDRSFHLLLEEEVEDDAFLFRSKPYNVPAVFQIWVRRDERRALKHVETEHPDFDFTTPDRADFAIQRVGARAGRVHRDFKRSPSSHYFVRGEVETIMAQLRFASVVRNVAGNPSLSKSEIVCLYREWTERR